MKTNGGYAQPGMYSTRTGLGSFVTRRLRDRSPLRVHDPSVRVDYRGTQHHVDCTRPTCTTPLLRAPFIMLHSLEFENFKSWAGPHRLEFGRITGLFGANSSGKSSIIHLLLLLKQTVESPDSTLVLNFGGSPSEYIDFGSFKDIVTHQRHN